jgi:hypothetical protein
MVPVMLMCADDGCLFKSTRLAAECIHGWRFGVIHCGRT